MYYYDLAYEDAAGYTYLRWFCSPACRLAYFFLRDGRPASFYTWCESEATLPEGWDPCFWCHGHNSI